MKMNILLGEPENGIIDTYASLEGTNLHELMEIEGSLYYQTYTSRYGLPILVKLAGNGPEELTKEDLHKLADEDGTLKVKYYEMEYGMVGR